MDITLMTLNTIVTDVEEHNKLQHTKHLFSIQDHTLSLSNQRQSNVIVLSQIILFYLTKKSLNTMVTMIDDCA